MTEVQRSCGSCTACCEGWLKAYFRDIELIPGNACPHLIHGTGCGIYDDRPKNPCRDFYCGWLKEPELIDEDLKPETCGAITLTDRNWQGWKVIRVIPTGEVVPEATLERLKALARRSMRPLLIVSFEKQSNGEYVKLPKMGYGPPEFVNQVKISITDKDIYRGEQAGDINAM